MTWQLVGTQEVQRRVALILVWVFLWAHHTSALAIILVARGWALRGWVLICADAIG